MFSSFEGQVQNMSLAAVAQAVVHLAIKEAQVSLELDQKCQSGGSEQT